MAVAKDCPECAKSGRRAGYRERISFIVVNRIHVFLVTMAPAVQLVLLMQIGASKSTCLKLHASFAELHVSAALQELAASAGSKQMNKFPVRLPGCFMRR